MLNLDNLKCGWTPEERHEAWRASCEVEEDGTKAQMYHNEFWHTVRVLAAVRYYKVTQYGVDRYTMTNALANAWLCYTDVKRKAVRLEQLTMHATTGNGAVLKEGRVVWDQAALGALVETYADLANYAIMACQILGRELR